MASLFIKTVINQVIIKLIKTIETLSFKAIETMVHTHKIKNFIKKHFLLVTNVSLTKLIKEMEIMIIKPEIQLDTTLNNDGEMHGGTHSGMIDNINYIINPNKIIPDITPEIVGEFLDTNIYKPLNPFIQVMTCKNCNNGFLVEIKDKIIFKMMNVISALITTISVTIFNNSVIYYSFKKVVDNIALNNDNLQPNGKLSNIINLFKKYIDKNKTQIDEIEKNEKLNIENLTNEEKYKKEKEEKMKERNKNIDVVSEILNNALNEINDYDVLSINEKKPEIIDKNLSSIIQTIDSSNNLLNANNSEMSPELNAQEIKNKEFKQKVNNLLIELRKIKNLPNYDERIEYKDESLNPNKRIESVLKELKELKELNN